MNCFQGHTAAYKYGSHTYCSDSCCKVGYKNHGTQSGRQEENVLLLNAKITLTHSLALSVVNFSCFFRTTGFTGCSMVLCCLSTAEFEPPSQVHPLARHHQLAANVPRECSHGKVCSQFHVGTWLKWEVLQREKTASLPSVRVFGMCQVVGHVCWPIWSGIRWDCIVVPQWLTGKHVPVFWLIEGGTPLPLPLAFPEVQEGLFRCSTPGTVLRSAPSGICKSYPLVLFSGETPGPPQVEQVVWPGGGSVLKHQALEGGRCPIYYFLVGLYDIVGCLGFYWDVAGSSSATSSSPRLGSDRVPSSPHAVVCQAGGSVVWGSAEFSGMATAHSKMCSNSLVLVTLLSPTAFRFLVGSTWIKQSMQTLSRTSLRQAVRLEPATEDSKQLFELGEGVKLWRIGEMCLSCKQWGKEVCP